MYGVVVNLLGFVNTFATPVALKNIRYNYVFIFVALDVIESVIWYFFAVETVGRTLEELAEVFEAPVRNIISLFRTRCALRLLSRTLSKLQSRSKLSRSGRTEAWSLSTGHS